MEPAVERREQPFNILGNIQLNDVPQWSPPVNGGSSDPAQVHVEFVVTPQWSPPVNGGSRQRLRLALAEVRPAAMEPAAERREHPGTHSNGTTPICVPQWNPPVNGGSRSLIVHRPPLGALPQWSPPSNGGRPDLTVGAAVSQFQPQWSPR